MENEFTPWQANQEYERLSQEIEADYQRRLMDLRMARENALNDIITHLKEKYPGWAFLDYCYYRSKNKQIVLPYPPPPGLPPHSSLD